MSETFSQTGGTLEFMLYDMTCPPNTEANMVAADILLMMMKFIAQAKVMRGQITAELASI